MKYLIDKIKKEIDIPFENNGYRLSNTHFEIGRFLHSEDYYFARKYFQNTDNCNDISELLVSKLTELQLPASTTLIGYGNYTGLFLKKTVEKHIDFNYAIIEKDESSFSWQFLPDLKNNLVIVLPITSTSSVYIRLRKFLIEYIDKLHKPSITVSNHFLNIFLLLDSDLEKKMVDDIDIDELKNIDHRLHKIYSPFNWSSIQKQKIIFNRVEPVFTAHPLILLFSKLHLSESCSICFPEPESLTTEKLLFPTQDNYEIPNLIFGFPNFGSSNSKVNDFFSVVAPVNPEKSSHLRGHITVNNRSYESYIRGNNFYENNKISILRFFNETLNNHLTEDDRNIIFITTDNKYSSSFLEDITSYPALRNRSVTVFRFQPFHEFVDNFISLHSNFIRQKGDKVIYFQEVLTAGKTFKLISNYLKHINDVGNHQQIHGFHFVFTLVDRMSAYTKREIIRKLYSKQNPYPNENLISFFNLNIPIISSSHLGNPLQDHIKRRYKIIEECHWDTLKLKINQEIFKQLPQNLPETIWIVDQEQKEIFFPFFVDDRESDIKIFYTYRKAFTRQNIDLFHLFLVHTINCELSKKKYKEGKYIIHYHNEPQLLIEDLLLELGKNAEIAMDIIFSFDSNSSDDKQYRNIYAEKEFIHDMLIKILSKPPFIYYKSIYEAIFRYCSIRISKIYSHISGGDNMSFKEFRALKFYIRRNIELNSNFIISFEFLTKLKIQYEKKNIQNLSAEYVENLEIPDADESNIEDLDYYKIKKRNLFYIQNQLNSYLSFLLYCYKELIYRNTSRSIKLEEIINHETCRPRNTWPLKGNLEDLKNLIQAPYYQFITMVKAENIFLLKELKELHKRNIRNGFKRKNFMEFYLTPNKKNDPIIINAHKLLEKSLYFNNKELYKNILESVSAMLDAVSFIENKNKLSDINNDSTDSQVDEENDKKDSFKKKNLNDEIKEILNKVVGILQPGIEKTKLKYAFCIEYRKSKPDNMSTDNLYTLVSDEDPESPQVIQLNKNGLICRLLYGLYSSRSVTTEQTIITAVKSGSDIFSFQNNFYVKKSLRQNSNDEFEEVSLQELYNNDYYDPQSGNGLPILQESNITLAFRLSKFFSFDRGLKSGLEGQAVLLITNSEEASPENFKKFMNIEKVRLLLLIKEELLQYLQKQFDNDAFIEILENRKREIFQRKLEHGLNRYRIAQRELYEAAVDTTDPLVKIKNKSLYDIIDKITQAQLNFKNLRKVSEEIESYHTSEILTRMQDIFSSLCFCGCSISPAEVIYIGFGSEPISIYPSIFDIIIPELVINMKKYSSRLIKGALQIEYNKLNNQLIFKNDTRKGFRKKEVKKDYGGIKMCEEIIEKLQLLPLSANPENDGFITVLNLNSK